jgi:hypothetical protein
MWIERESPESRFLYIGARTQVPGQKKYTARFYIDINVLPQIILYNSCVRAGGRVKAPACHSSLMDVYWKSFPPSDKGNFYTQLAPVRYWKIYFHWLASESASIGKIIGRKKRLDLSMKLPAALHNVAADCGRNACTRYLEDDACFLWSELLLRI